MCVILHRRRQGLATHSGPLMPASEACGGRESPEFAPRAGTVDPLNEMDVLFYFILF